MLLLIYRKLEFHSRPDYAFIYDQLQEVMVQGGFQWTDPYDWEAEAATGLRKILSIHGPLNSSSLKLDKAKGVAPSFSRQDFAEDKLGF